MESKGARKTAKTRGRKAAPPPVEEPEEEPVALVLPEDSQDTAAPLEALPGPPIGMPPPPPLPPNAGLPASSDASSGLPHGAPAASPSKSNLGLALLIIVIVLGAIVVLAFMASTYLPGSSSATACASNLYTTDGSCCSYVCSNTNCPAGYKPGTCNCECASSDQPKQAGASAAPSSAPSNSNSSSGAPASLTPPSAPANPHVDDVFASPSGVSPPSLPK